MSAVLRPGTSHVELAFGDAAFELRAGDADRLVQLRTGAANVMWQKERLLNEALRRLPGGGLAEHEDDAAAVRGWIPEEIDPGSSRRCRPRTFGAAGEH